jgi:hypothetical protein
MFDKYPKYKETYGNSTNSGAPYNRTYCVRLKPTVKHSAQDRSIYKVLHIVQIIRKLIYDIGVSNYRAAHVLAKANKPNLPVTKIRTN